jgi:hypothetical protein
VSAPAQEDVTMIIEPAPDYREQEENRADVHGHGYRMIVDLQREHAALGNPFEVLQHLYPPPRRW